MKKDDIIELTIEDLGINGEGIGKADGMAIFVKDAVVGDRIRAKIMKMKKNYGYARLLEVLEPSPVRCTPRCEFARQCGGCQLQAMTYEAQLDFKAKKSLESSDPYWRSYGPCSAGDHRHGRSVEIPK